MTRDPRVNPLVGRAARNAETQIRYRGKGGGRVSGRTRGFRQTRTATPNRPWTDPRSPGKSSRTWKDCR